MWKWSVGNTSRSEFQKTLYFKVNHQLGLVLEPAVNRALRMDKIMGLNYVFYDQRNLTVTIQWKHQLRSPAWPWLYCSNTANVRIPNISWASISPVLAWRLYVCHLKFFWMTNFLSSEIVIFWKLLYFSLFFLLS